MFLLPPMRQRRRNTTAMHYMWPYDYGFYADSDRPLDAGKWSDALTRAVLRKDADAARGLFDHTFWHNTDFKPDWFHLYLAVQQQDRAMVQLLVTHGAHFDKEQMTIAAAALKEVIAPFKSILAEGGMRLDRVDTENYDARTAIAMDKRLLAENAKLGHANPQETTALDLAIVQFGVRAARRKNMAEARDILHQTSGGVDGVDLAPFFRHLAATSAAGLDAAVVLGIIDDVRGAGVNVQPLALETLSGKVEDFYTLVAALDARGVLGGDTASLRDAMLHSWCFAQTHLTQGDFSIEQPPDAAQRQRAAFAAAAKVICGKDSDVTPDEARRYADLHARQAPRHGDAVAHMDETLLQTGFFGAAAFTPALLESLGAAAPTEALRREFNKQAQARQFEDKGLYHFLSPKRFDTLRAALRSGAFVPDADDSEDILRYLKGRCARREVPEDVVQTLREMKTAGADFRGIEVTDYLGAKHPLLAKTLLDLDIVSARDIRPQRLSKRIAPHKGLGGMFVQNTDRDYALSEFLYQVMFERTYPERTQDMRAKRGVSYQRAYTLAQVSKQIEAIKALQSPPRPSPTRRDVIKGRRGPRPGY